MNFLDTIKELAQTTGDVYGTILAARNQKTTAQQAVQQQADATRLANTWKPIAVIGVIILAAAGLLIAFRRA